MNRTTITKYLTGTVKCLKPRAESICNEEYIKKEYDQPDNAPQHNSYPKELVHKLFYKNKGRKKNNEENDNDKKSLITPYVKGLSERIEKISLKMNLRVVFKYNNSIRKRLLMERVSNNKKGVVYKNPCGKCNFCYVGDPGT